ncbi:uncharacterized protein V6R79_010228 [Siganus canaliculatus]
MNDRDKKLEKLTAPSKKLRGTAVKEKRGNGIFLKSSTDKNRIPSTLWEAECSSSSCSGSGSGSAEDQNLNSVPIHQSILVLTRVNRTHCYSASFQTVAVGCTCIRTLCLLFFLDHVGVAVHQYSCALALFFYSADATWTQSMLGQVFLPAAALLAWTSCAVCCYTKLRFQQPLIRKLLQVAPMGVAYLLDISPVVHRLSNYSWTSSAALPLHFLQVVLLLLSAFFFSCPIPECFCPGSFDIVGHAHQLFHVLLWFGMMAQQEALFHDFLWRRPALVRDFGEERLLLASVVMATVGADVTGSWFLSLGLVGSFVLLLLLSIFLSGLCSNCGRRSFELQDPELDRNPPSLIRVKTPFPSFHGGATCNRTAKVSVQHYCSSEEVQGNSAIKRTATGPDPVAEEQQDGAMVFTSWRNHLGAPQSQDLNHSNHIYQVIRGGRSSFNSNGDALSLTTNQEQVQEPCELSEPAEDIKSMYARVSKRTKTNQTPEQVKEEVKEVKEEEEEEAEEAEAEAEPPVLLDRIFELDEDGAG